MRRWIWIFLAIASAMQAQTASSAQRNQQAICDHAAPPRGMHWVCDKGNSCDCHLEGKSPALRDDEDTTAPPIAPVTEQMVAEFVVPDYPRKAITARREGSVQLLVDSDALGAVTNARVLNGDKSFADAALEAVQSWKLAKPEAKGIPLTVRFALAGDGRRERRRKVTIRPNELELTVELENPARKKKQQSRSR